MTAQPTAADDLREAAEALRRQNAPACHRVAEGLEAFLAGAVDSTDEALGVRRRRGESTLATMNAQAERDRLIVEAVARHYAGQKRQRAAELLASDIARYEETGWRRGERDADICPTRLRGRPYEFAWRILKAKPTPIGAGRIAQILASARNETPGIHFETGGRCSPDNLE